MATYSAVTAGEKDADSPINVSLIDKLDQNPLAIAEGASGAPKIQNAAFADNSINGSRIVSATIDQGSLNTGQGEVSTSSGIVNATLPGGEYGFYPNIRSSANAVLSAYQVGNYTASPVPTTNTCIINLEKKGGGGGTVYAVQRYINAAPPHAIDSVDYRDFIFLLLDKNGDVISGWMATDPPWFHNGPTKTNPNLGPANGFKRRRAKKIPDSLRNLSDKKEFVEKFKALNYEEIDIDANLKNADMPLIPHPFNGAEGNIVIIEPGQSGVYSDLCDLYCDGESALELIHEGFLKVDTSEINTSGKPPGVPMHRIKWK